MVPESNANRGNVRFAMASTWPPRMGVHTLFSGEQT